MKNIVRFPEKSGLQEKAIQWLIKMEDDDWSDQEKKEFLIWIDKDPQHRKMFLRVASFWCEMDVLASMDGLLTQQIEKDRGVNSAPNALHRKWFHPRHIRWAAGLAACSFLVAGLLFVLPLGTTLDPGHKVAQPIDIFYETRLGEQTRAVLQDGSIMTLNTQTQATVKFDSTERSVYLESGEAYFEVAKNKERPFHVYAGKGRITAIGTAFNVRVQSEHVNVAVTEGSVEVAARMDSDKDLPATQLPSSLLLKKTGIVNYTDAIEHFEYIAPEKIEKQLAWKRGKLAFEGETLEQVIAETNRYTQKKLKIADPSIAHLRVGGLFDAGDIDQLLALFKGSFGIEVVEKKEDFIYLAIPAQHSINTR